MLRYAIVRGARSQREVEAYLPDNYEVIYEYAADDPIPSRNEGPDARPNTWVIAGEDKYGWGLDTYISPRLASGLMGCEEIDLSHPVMKRVPIGALSDAPVIVFTSEAGVTATFE